jgi:hypothetical protein
MNIDRDLQDYLVGDVLGGVEPLNGPSANYEAVKALIEVPGLGSDLYVVVLDGQVVTISGNPDREIAAASAKTTPGNSHLTVYDLDQIRGYVKEYGE